MLPLRAIFFHAVEQRLQVARRDGQRLLVGILLAIGILLVAHLLFSKFLNEFVERRAQLVHQALQFFGGRATIQRFAQLLLRGAQIALGLRKIAILKAKRHFPHQVGDGEKIGITSSTKRKRCEIVRSPR